MLAHSWLSSDLLRVITYLLIASLLVVTEFVAVGAVGGGETQTETDLYAGSVLATQVLMCCGSASIHGFQMAVVARLATENKVANAESSELAQHAIHQELLVGRRVNRLVSDKIVRRWKTQVGRYMFTERKVCRAVDPRRLSAVSHAMLNDQAQMNGIV